MALKLNFLELGTLLIDQQFRAFLTSFEMIKICIKSYTSLTFWLENIGSLEKV